MKHLRIKTRLFQRAALSLLTLVMAFTTQTAWAGSYWYDVSMSIGGITTNPSTWSGSPDNPTYLGFVSDMTITSIAFKISSDNDDRNGANMYFQVFDDNGQVGQIQDLWLGSATKIEGDHKYDFAISYTTPYDLANKVELNLVPGKDYYIDVWAKSYQSDVQNDQWYSNNGANYHAKLTIAPTAYDVTANSAKGAYWATFFTEAVNYQASEGTQVFAVNLNTSTAEITMTEIPNRIVKKGQGVVLKNITTSTITMTKTEIASDGDFSSNSLTGTRTEITNPGNAYVLNYKESAGVGFYKLSDSGTIGANRAYLKYTPPTPPSGGAREYFLFDDEKTGIKMPTVEGNDADAVVYDLQGRRVQNPTKGLYIVNGKKVIIK